MSTAPLTNRPDSLVPSRPVSDAGLSVVAVLVAVAMVIAPISMMAYEAYLLLTAVESNAMGDQGSGWVALACAVLLALVPLMVARGVHKRSRGWGIAGMVLATGTVLIYVLNMGLCG